MDAAGSAAPKVDDNQAVKELCHFVSRRATAGDNAAMVVIAEAGVGRESLDSSVLLGLPPLSLSLSLFLSLSVSRALSLSLSLSRAPRNSCQLSKNHNSRIERWETD